MRYSGRYLKKLGREQPHLANLMNKFQTLYREKNWDRLEYKIMQYMEETEQVDRFELYKYFIVHFELKVNPLWLVEYASRIAEQWTEPESVITMIETHFKPKVLNCKLAAMHCDVLLGEQLLLMGNRRAVQKILDECSIDYSSHHNIMNLRHFKLAMRHYQLLGDHTKRAQLKEEYMRSKSLHEFRVQMQHLEFSAFMDEVYRKPLNKPYSI